MRLCELRRVDQIFQNPDNKQVRLVIMGHTHGPTLIEIPGRRRMAPLAEGWLMYQNGKYWMKKEQVVTTP
jgi:hypothetical protein